METNNRPKKEENPPKKEDSMPFSGYSKPARKETRGNTSKVLPFLVAILFGASLALGYMLIQQNARIAEMEQDFNDQIVELQSALPVFAERVDEHQNRLGSLASDLHVIEQRVGVTQEEIGQARKLAERIRKDQDDQVNSLTQQIVAKADAVQLKDLEQTSETKFQEVGHEITEVKEDLQQSRSELEEAWRKLSNLDLRVSEQGSLIATTREGLQELVRRGERDYLEFDIVKGRRAPVAAIQVELRDTNRKHQHADLRLYYDDKRIVRKKVYTNTPLVFYVGRDQTQYELVINQVDKGRIEGYVSLPKGAAKTETQVVASR